MVAAARILVLQPLVEKPELVIELARLDLVARNEGNTAKVSLIHLLFVLVDVQNNEGFAFERLF